MDSSPIRIDKRLIEAAYRLQNEYREVFDEDLEMNDENTTRLINQMLSDYMQDLEDIRELQKSKKNGNEDKEEYIEAEELFKKYGLA